MTKSGHLTNLEPRQVRLNQRKLKLKMKFSLKPWISWIQTMAVESSKCGCHDFGIHTFHESTCSRTFLTVLLTSWQTELNNGSCGRHSTTFLNPISHFMNSSAERNHYCSNRLLVEQQPQKYLSVITDGMDQAKTNIPHFTSVSKMSSFFIQTTLYLLA